MNAGEAELPRLLFLVPVLLACMLGAIGFTVLLRRTLGLRARLRSYAALPILRRLGPARSANARLAQAARAVPQLVARSRRVARQFAQARATVVTSVRDVRSIFTR